MNRIFERVEVRRHELGITIKDLCAITEIPEPTYRNWIHGRSDRADVECIHRLSVALKTPMDYLVAPTDDTPASQVQKEIIHTNTTPATTQEMDSAIAVLMRTIQAEYERIAAAKEEQHSEERAAMLAQLAAKDKTIRQLILCICALVAVLCIGLIVCAIV